MYASFTRGSPGTTSRHRYDSLHPRQIPPTQGFPRAIGAQAAFHSARSPMPPQRPARACTSREGKQTAAASSRRSPRSEAPGTEYSSEASEKTFNVRQMIRVRAKLSSWMVQRDHPASCCLCPPCHGPGVSCSLPGLSFLEQLSHSTPRLRWETPLPTSHCSPGRAQTCRSPHLSRGNLDELASHPDCRA